MNAATEAMATPAQAAATRPFYWLVRRELWEHRSLLVTPLAVGGVILLAVILNALQLPTGMRSIAQLEPERQSAVVTGFFGGIAAVIAVTMAIVAWFYCLDAMYGERRDRSILFWKSLPISDTSTVLSKLFVAGVGVPVITFVVALALQLTVLLLATLALLVAGESAAPLWTHLPFTSLALVLLYALCVHSLWYAPIYGWLLLVSSWSRRSPFLWSVLPPFGVVLFEKIAFDSDRVAEIIGHRLAGGLPTAFRDNFAAPEVAFFEGERVQFAPRLLDMLDPAALFSDPQLWVGLGLAAGLVAATVWMRRYREPI